MLPPCLPMRLRLSDIHEFAHAGMAHSWLPSRTFLADLLRFFSQTGQIFFTISGYTVSCKAKQPNTLYNFFIQISLLAEQPFPRGCSLFLCHRKLRPMTQKTLRGMRTRAKKKHVASGRARRENVPRHILSYSFSLC